MAAVRTANVFSSHMVVQQDKPFVIWGTADAGEQVTVTFAGKKATTKADSDGRWQATLPAMKANGKGQTVTIKGKNDKQMLADVLIGEVWLASGQSNMEYSMNNHPKYKKPQKGDPDRLQKEWEQASNPHIRLLYVEKNLKTDTLPTSGWQTVTKESLQPFSAAAWFFAKMLQDSLQVPVGIISTSWGGTKIEVWTPGKGDRYEHMVRPIAPLALRGFLWYQGETNLINGDVDAYQPKFEGMVKAWREAWGDDTLPFYYVQISPYTYSLRKDYIVPHTWQDLPRFWTVQSRCQQTIPNSGMVVTTDIPERLDDIHPPYKWIVGERLCRWALNHTYGHSDVECQGPVLKSATREGSKVVLEFDHADGGLTTSDGKQPDWFYANTKGGRFAKAKVELDGNRIIVEVGGQKHPVVRFGFDEVAQPNLRNRAGLPAESFEVKL